MFVISNRQAQTLIKLVMLFRGTVGKFKVQVADLERGLWAEGFQIWCEERSIKFRPTTKKAFGTSCTRSMRQERSTV